jgi:hypothetical protein
MFEDQQQRHVLEDVSVIAGMESMAVIHAAQDTMAGSPRPKVQVWRLTDDRRVAISRVE